MESCMRRMRKDRGYTLKEAAAATGLNHATISRAERGIKTPSSETLYRLARLYECSMEELIEDQNYKNEGREE